MEKIMISVANLVIRNDAFLYVKAHSKANRFIP